MFVGPVIAPAVAIDLQDDLEEDIEWLAAEGITKGCNPSAGNTRFCPTD